MVLEERDLYEIVLSKEDELAEQYDSMPPATSDIDVEISGEKARGGVMLDHSDLTIYLDPSVTYMKSDHVEDLAEFGIKHLSWHPNHALGFRTEKFSQRNFYGTETVGEYEPAIMGETVEASPEEAVRDIYSNAVDQFKHLFNTDFETPMLRITEDVSEYSEWFDDYQQVGYEIDVENDMILLNEEIVDDLHPHLLNEDFRYMIKRYHDLSAQQAVEKRFVPYVENLRPNGSVEVEDVVFKDLSDSTRGAYNPSQQRMKLDYSLLPQFNPKTGRFENPKGESTLLHEEIHDLDFSVNQSSRDYLSAVSETDTDDPRNAVLEAPTTFEVFMAGWNRRPEAVEAFKDPLDNRDFFRDYPATDMTNSDSKSIAYPYNMGLITALTLHESMMAKQGVEEGTETTRDILYSNKWDLEHMGRALESAFEERDVPNIPLHRRETHEIGEQGEEAVLEEAERLLENASDWTLEEVVRGREVIHEYKKRNGFDDPPETMDELDRIVYQMERDSEQL